jgi:hypothetical protein
MQWAIGTVFAFLLVVGVGGAIASRALADDPTPTPRAAPSPSRTASVTPTTGPTATATAAATVTPTAAPPTATPPPPSLTATSLAATPPGAPSLTPRPSPSATPNVRRMTSAELSLLLRAHVESQRAQFRDGKARFAPPDQVVITGSTTVGGQPAAVEAILTVGADGGGRPKVLAYRLTQGGRPAAQPLQAAMAARVAQTNAELDQAVPRSQRVRRVWVTADAINGEFAE